MLQPNDVQYKKSTGFTLIELAIVLIIAGLLTTAAMQSYDVYQKDLVIRKTERAMARADEAINKYYARYGRFPCPADPAKINTWRGKEWGRDRQIEGTGTNNDSSQYDSDGNGYIDASDSWYPPAAKKVWLNGKDGPISDVYCREDPADTHGDLYDACIRTGQASQCKLAINPLSREEKDDTNTNTATSDVNNRWPTPEWADQTGDQKCGASLSQNGNIPSKHACVATGERPDDAALDENGDPITNNATLEPPTDVLPEEISCIDLGGGGASPCTPDDLKADDLTAGGDGSVPGHKSMAARGLQVLIGGLPFFDLGVSETELLDGYGNPLRYAVTLALTKKEGIDTSQGGIVLTTQEPGTNIVGPKTSDRPHGRNVISQEMAKYVIISHGKNATDEAFYASANGGSGTTAILSMTPRVVSQCKGSAATGGNYTNNGAYTGDGYIENENCDADANFVTSPGLTTSWNGEGTAPQSHFDDLVISDLRSTSASLWIANEGDVYNTNAGNVGIGIENPLSKLSIVSDMRVRGDLELGAGAKICGSSSGDTDYNGSYDCGGSGIDVSNIVDGTTCPTGMMLTSVKNAGGDVANYTCTYMISALPTQTCPPTSTSPNVKYSVLSGYDPVGHTSNPLKCVDPAHADVCKWCNGTGLYSGTGCISCP